MLRNHSKKLEGEIDKLLAAFTPDGVTTLKAYKLNYEEQIKKINEVDVEIANLCTNQEELEAEMESTLLANDIFFCTLSKINEQLAKATETEDKRNTVVSHEVSPASTRVLAAEQKVKLPKIELKTFDGNILNWQQFWDQFESSVHTQRGLSRVDKFSYLKSLLSSSAEECIAGLALTQANYDEAVELLQERFGNKQLLINAYIENFEGLPKVKSMSHVSELRVMYDQIESTVRNLKTLDVDSDTYGYFLAPLLVKRLPDELKMIMSRKFKKDVWELKEMMIIFKEELEAKERCTFSPTAIKSDDEQYTTSSLHQQYQRT